MIDRQLKTGKQDLDRAIRQSGDSLNWLERTGVLIRTLVRGKPGWKLPVVDTVTAHETRLDGHDAEILDLQERVSGLESRLAKLEQVVSDLLFDHTIKIGLPPKLAAEFAEAAGRQ